MADFIEMEIETPKYKGFSFFIPQHEKAYLWTTYPKKLGKRHHWRTIIRVADSFYVPPDHADAIRQEIVDAGFTVEAQDDPSSTLVLGA